MDDDSGRRAITLYYRFMVRLCEEWLWTKYSLVKGQRVGCLREQADSDHIHCQFTPENIPHRTAEACKLLKRVVFIGANNIRCFYLRRRSDGSVVVSSPGTRSTIYIYICVQ